MVDGVGYITRILIPSNSMGSDEPFSSSRSNDLSDFDGMRTMDLEQTDDGFARSGFAKIGGGRDSIEKLPISFSSCR